jgi:hypothetical protein
MTESRSTLEDRLHAALDAEAAHVHPADDAGAGPIRARVVRVRRRRRAALAVGATLAVVAVAVAAPLLTGDGGGRVSTDTDPADSPETTAEPPTPTTQTTTPTTTPPPAGDATAADDALWPDPTGTLFDDPVVAVRAFAQQVVGVDDPPLSAFRPDGPDGGEVDVLRRSEGGAPLDAAASTVTVQRLDGAHWFVMEAGSADVVIDTPRRMDSVSSPLTVSGRGRGYEGTIVATLKGRSDPAGRLADAATIAGAGTELEPFTVELSFADPGGGVGIVLATDDAAAEGTLPRFAARAVRFGAGSEGTSGAYSFRHQPLFPFASAAEAETWRTAGGGSQPWHADAEATALAFTAWLGFDEIGQVTSRDIRAAEAWVGVGYTVPSGDTATAAVIHLLRFGPAADAPWEVVGTRDTTLTLDTPRYGSTASSPLTVGGLVTGVDENLRVQVRQLSSEAPLGESCCLPAGGVQSPWSATVSYAGATDAALTVVVSTGGHLQGVEVFAITGLRR